MPALVFWLTLGLIVTVFVRMVETNRRKSQVLAKQHRDALNDPVTGLRNRQRAVAYRAISLARRLEMSREEIDDVALAAELQDVGLLAVPESVLEKSRSTKASWRWSTATQPRERGSSRPRRGWPAWIAWCTRAPSASTATDIPTAWPKKKSRWDRE